MKVIAVDLDLEDYKDIPDETGVTIALWKLRELVKGYRQSYEPSKDDHL